MRRHGRCGAAGEGPYSNTDLGSGHGTHVAGIIAADSSSVKDGSRYGVAPDAHLACFAIGAVLFTTGRDGVRLHARPAAHVARQGVTVVFAAGNSGSENAQMSLNPFSQSLWVSVAAGSVDRHRGDFSSNGLVSDNSRPVGITAGGHTTFTGHLDGLPARRGSRSRAEAGTAGADARPGSARPPGDGDEGDARPPSPAGPAVSGRSATATGTSYGGGLLDDAPRVTLGGSDSRTYRVQVGRGVDVLRVTLAHPSLASVGANLTSYTVTIRDLKGKVIGTTTESPTAGSGTATAFLPLRKVRSGVGPYTLSVSGDYAASDPDTLDSDSVLGRMVTLHVAQVSRG